MTEYQLKRMVFLAIQTVGISRTMGELPTKRMQELWIKSKEWKEEADYEKLYEAEAGLTAEFGQIVQVNMGRIKEDEDGEWSAKIVSIGGEEETLLKKSAEILEGIMITNLCGHNIKEFTIPFLVKRLRIRGITKIPDCLCTGKKPWEINCLDTLELWQAGSRVRTSLELIAEVLGMSEEEGKGTGTRESIHELFWSGRREEIEKIGRQKVLATINIVLSISGRARITKVEWEQR
jgi:hypothetical protein